MFNIQITNPIDAEVNPEDVLRIARMANTHLLERPVRQESKSLYFVRATPKRMIYVTFTPAKARGVAGEINYPVRTAGAWCTLTFSFDVEGGKVEEIERMMTVIVAGRLLESAGYQIKYLVRSGNGGGGFFDSESILSFAPESVRSLFGYTGVVNSLNGDSGIGSSSSSEEAPF